MRCPPFTSANVNACPECPPPPSSPPAEINQLQWSAAQPDWIAIAFGSKLQILRV